MVSRGDTAISLHIRGEGGVQTNTIQSAKICPNLHWGGGGGVVVQTKSTQSAKICPNLHLDGGGGGVWFREWGHSRNFEPKILVTGMCSASQIVFHILRMWGLMKNHCDVERKTPTQKYNTFILLDISMLSLA